MFSTSISNVFVTRVNSIVAETDDNNILTRLFTKDGRIQFVVMSLVLSGFIFVGHTFVKIWAGLEYQDSYYVTLLLIVPVTIPLIQNLGIEIQMAKNKHKTRSIVYFIVAIINVFISIPLIKMMGPKGAALGTAISLVVGNVLFMNWYYYSHIGLDMWHFWKNIIKLMPALILPCIFGIVAKKIIIIDSAATIVLFSALYVIVYVASMWFLGLNEEEKNYIRKPVIAVQKWLKNKRKDRV